MKDNTTPDENTLGHLLGYCDCIDARIEFIHADIRLGPQLESSLAVLNEYAGRIRKIAKALEAKNIEDQNAIYAKAHKQGNDEGYEQGHADGHAEGHEQACAGY